MVHFTRLWIFPYSHTTHLSSSDAVSGPGGEIVLWSPSDVWAASSAPASSSALKPWLCLQCPVWSLLASFLVWWPLLLRRWVPSTACPLECRRGVEEGLMGRRAAAGASASPRCWHCCYSWHSLAAASRSLLLGTCRRDSPLSWRGFWCSKPAVSVASSSHGGSAKSGYTFCCACMLQWRWRLWKWPWEQWHQRACLGFAKACFYSASKKIPKAPLWVGSVKEHKDISNSWDWSLPTSKCCPMSVL